MQVQYERIVARKTLINALLRIVFLGLVMAKLSSDALLSWSIRVVTVPLWIQLMVLLVMLHTSVKRLQDPMCTRAFKKHSAYIELHLLASLFIAMKMDAALSWSWIAVFWPLWVPIAGLMVGAIILSCVLPCTLLLILCQVHLSRFT